MTAIVLGVALMLACGIAIRATFMEAVANADAKWLREALTHVREDRDREKDEVARLRKLVITRATEYGEEKDAVRTEARQRYELRERQLLEQIQVMAERIAGIKITSTVPGEVAVEDGPAAYAPDHTIPYSDELFQFVSAIESEDARQLVEDYVERERASGRMDHEIVETLSRGEFT